MSVERSKSYHSGTRRQYESPGIRGKARRNKVVWSCGMNTISLPGQRITSFENMGVVEQLEHLYVQNNNISSLKSLEEQPRLVEMRLDMNHIKDFRDAKPQGHLHSISLESNPIMKSSNVWQLAAVVVYGSLKKINSQPVTMTLRNLAKSLGERGKAAVLKGWVPKYIHDTRNNGGSKSATSMLPEIQPRMPRSVSQYQSLPLPTLDELNQQIDEFLSSAGENTSMESSMSQSRSSSTSEDDGRNEIIDLKRSLLDRENLLSRAREQLGQLWSDYSKLEESHKDALRAAETYRNSLRIELSSRKRAEERVFELEKKLQKLQLKVKKTKKQEQVEVEVEVEPEASEPGPGPKVDNTNTDFDASDEEEAEDVIEVGSVMECGWDFEAHQADELSIHEGEELIVVQIMDKEFSGWIQVKNEAGETGIVPRNFLMTI